MAIRSTWPSTSVPLQRIVRWLLVVLCVLSVTVSALYILGWTPTDYRILAEAGRRAGTPQLYQLYDVEPFRWSPLAAWLLVPLAAIGPLGWVVLHIAAAFAFGSPRVTALLLLAFPFWHDALSGNVMIFVVLAAWWAVKESRVATVAYFVLVLIMPRPIMLPVAVWLLWQRPEWRAPFAAMAIVHTACVLATGLAAQWIGAVMSQPVPLLEHHLNYGPSRAIGHMWWMVGGVLAAWLTFKGRLGWASIAASPYLFPYYALFGLVELHSVGWRQDLGVVSRAQRDGRNSPGPFRALGQHYVTMSEGVPLPVTASPTGMSDLAPRG